MAHLDVKLLAMASLFNFFYYTLRDSIEASSICIGEAFNQLQKLLPLGILKN